MLIKVEHDRRLVIEESEIFIGLIVDCDGSLRDDIFMTVNCWILE